MDYPPSIPSPPPLSCPPCDNYTVFFYYPPGISLCTLTAPNFDMKEIVNNRPAWYNMLRKCYF